MPATVLYVTLNVTPAALPNGMITVSAMMGNLKVSNKTINPAMGSVTKTSFSEFAQYSFKNATTANIITDLYHKLDRRHTYIGKGM